MFFLNLTSFEFFTLLAAVGGFISALYLLDRARGKKIVSTLQFWVAAGATEQRRPRKRVREPWSLLLQLLGLLLLLLAIARFEWGSRAGQGRDHVLLIDTSAWSAARAAEGGGTVLEREKEKAQQYIASLGGSDRVMLVAAGALAEPVSPFTSNRVELDDALARLRSGYDALNAEAALAFAAQARNLRQNAAGEIAYIGPGLVDRPPSASEMIERVLPVAANREDCGIVQLTAEPISNEPGGWRSVVSIKNYGTTARTIVLAMTFEKTPFTPRHMVVAAGAEVNAEYLFTTTSAGELKASIQPGDSLALDDSASISLPANNTLHLSVYTDRRDLLRPLFASDTRLRADFPPAAAYRANASSDIVILDRFAPSQAPRASAIWIDPPAEHSPLPRKTSEENTLVKFAEQSVKPVPATQVNVFEAFEDDQILASVSAGPVVVFRAPKKDQAGIAVIGYDPLAGAARFDVSTPLLFANLIDRLRPGAFREQSYSAEPVGLARVQLEAGEENAGLRVVNGSGSEIPFTRRKNELQIFVSRPTIVHITSGGHERVLDLGLPAVAVRQWTPGTSERGVPARGSASPAAHDLWRWLALAAALVLALEWYLFGRSRGFIPIRRSMHQETNEPERELVAK